jgi:hypothetical protein
MTHVPCRRFVKQRIDIGLRMDFAKRDERHGDDSAEHVAWL